MARQQWYENQQIRKRAEERARQAELGSYEQAPVEQDNYRPQSNRDSRNNSRQKKQSYQMEPPKKYSMPQEYDPSQEELQNALLNPHFKKTPQSANPKKSASKYNSNESHWTNDSKKKEQYKPSSDIRTKVESKKNYEEEREKMKRDREEFMKQKGLKVPDETLKPAKWGRKSREKSTEVPTEPTEPEIIPEKVRQSPKKKYEQSVMESEDLRLNIKDKEEFNDYLNELEDLLGNVNKNIEKMEVMPEIQQVEEQIVVREDCQEFDYSITASFDGVKLKPEEEINVENADLDYFSSYSKLQDLRICLEDKFGTDNFIKIYRALQKELEMKGLANFNILEVVKNLEGVPNQHLIAENVPLLLTLIVMEEKMSCV